MPGDVKMSYSEPFRWSPVREAAALRLAEGYTQAETAEAAGVSERTVQRWLTHPDFAAEVNRLTFMVGIAQRAERLRLAMRVARQRVRDDGSVATEKDLLDWLKYAQGETDGVKLDLTALAEAAGAVADS